MLQQKERANSSVKRGSGKARREIGALRTCNLTAKVPCPNPAFFPKGKLNRIKREVGKAESSYSQH